jgi:hypothetical protein
LCETGEIIEKIFRNLSGSCQRMAVILKNRFQFVNKFRKMLAYIKHFPVLCDDVAQDKDDESY